MALQIILALLLLLWVGHAIVFNALRVKRGRWYYLGAFNKIWGKIDGDRTAPFIPLFWPLRVIEIELTWTEYQQMNETYEGGVRNYGNVEKAIGTKTAFTNIRKLEEHPIEVSVTLKDGYVVNLIFDTTLRVYDPMLLVPVKQFLTYVQQEFSDVVSPWAKKKKDIDSILIINIDDLQRQLKIDHVDENGDIKKMSLREYLDTLKFEPRGFCIKELSMKVGLPPAAQKYFEIQNQTKQEEAQKIRLEAVEKRREVERTIFTNDANTEREVQKEDLKVTEDYQINVINALYKGQQDVAAAYKAETLVINNNDSGKNDVTETKMLTSALTGGLIVHKRLSSIKNEKSEESKSEMGPKKKDE